MRIKRKFGKYFYESLLENIGIFTAGLISDYFKIFNYLLYKTIGIKLENEIMILSKLYLFLLIFTIRFSNKFSLLIFKHFYKKQIDLSEITEYNENLYSIALDSENKNIIIRAFQFIKNILESDNQNLKISLLAVNSKETAKTINICSRTITEFTNLLQNKELSKNYQQNFFAKISNKIGDIIFGYDSENMINEIFSNFKLVDFAVNILSDFICLKDEILLKVKEAQFINTEKYRIFDLIVFFIK